MARRQATYTADSPQVNVKLEPELDDALRQLMAGNGVRSRGEMARLLIRRGIRAVAEEASALPPPPADDRPPLTPAQVVERGAYLVEQLSDLLARSERTDPVRSVVLARGVEKAARGWADDRAAVHGVGLSRDERLAELVDSLTVLARTAPPAECVSLWHAVLGAVTARSREDYQAVTGERLAAGEA